ncbi:hypothetical protein O0I10_005077 [Lichtheimia ornata]|uniref:Uncharacterized protein n=1 Tax=Lichtheimia ornata TaxID=688661 RepID=A0AAD7V524_9FUNG|nr:uncharacterized protein O0I10_005077 [Lichtheimia ornata]KAJ8659039.1 hypothetical protein O0I10_005077 [Lichtheimia ornata]
MNTFAVQLPSSEPGKSDRLCNAPSSDMRKPHHRLRPMQSQPNMRYAATATSTTQVTPFTVHAISPPSTLPSFMTSTTHTQQPSKQPQQQPMSRTQQKLMLQRQCFLADDKNYLDHPTNMRRLTKELDRVNREYRYIRHFEDPLAASFRRVTAAAAASSSSSSSFTSTTTSSLSPSSSNYCSPILQRRSSAQEILSLVATKENVKKQQDRLIVRFLGNAK